MARVLSLAAVVLGAASTVVGQVGPTDHMLCTSIKDSLPKTTYAARFNGVQCMVRTPAKVLCFPGVKGPTSPPDPGAPPGPALTVPYACYKVKCERPLATVNLVDQFGSRVVVLKQQRLLCAPGATSPSGAFLDETGPP